MSDTTPTQVTSDSRIAGALAAGREARRPLVIPFVTAGFPSLTATVPIVGALADAGADLVEIGMPFSDPLADGPTIQRASELALRNGATVAKTLAMVGELRSAGLKIPVLLMGYCNPIYAYGLESFLTDAAEVGVDGLIVPDLPPDEADGYLAGCRATGLAAVFLVAPNAPDDRIRKVDAASTHFSYCVTVTGVTGARRDLEDRTVGFLERMQALATKPFVVGFGIKEAEHVKALGPHAAGVVFGSALIDAIETALEDAGVEAGDARLDEVAALAAGAAVAPLRAAAEAVGRSDPGGAGGGR